MNQNKNPLAFFSLGLLLAAILVPFIIVALGRDDLAVGFSIVALLMALVLGAFSKSVRLGKAAVAGLALFFVVGVTLILLFSFLHARQIGAQNYVQMRAEQDRVIAEINARRSQQLTPIR